MARPLREGIGALELTAKVTLAVLALASGVYTYIGVRDLLDGSATVVFLGAFIYSAAVSVGIYAFWTFLMRLMPHVRQASHRNALIGAIVLGSVMIMAMSSWLNAAALAGSAAIEQHLSRAAEGYADALDKAHSNALAAQSLLPDIQLASARFARLASDERASGALTGTSGSGTVVQLLTQMSNDLRGLGDEITQSRETVKTLYEEGGQHIARMRALVSANGPVSLRADQFGEEAVALAGVIASLQQTSVAPAVRRAADDLATTFIAPVADGGTEDLRNRQETVVENVASAVAAQSKALATAADQVLATETGQARAVRAAVAPGSGASLRRRLPPLLGGRDLDRPAAGRARADPRRRAQRDPARGGPADRRQRHDRRRHDAGDAALRAHAARRDPHRASRRGRAARGAGGAHLPDRRCTPSPAAGAGRTA